VGGGDRLLAYCLRCSRYRQADEFLLANLEAGQHCAAEDCSRCFRHGTRWCWYCVGEELAANPEKVSDEAKRELAAAAELSELVSWLWSLLDERLHAALGRPLHAAWGQPHFCAQLPAEAEAATTRVLAELGEAHRRLKQESLFGQLEQLPWEATLGPSLLAAAGSRAEPTLRQAKGRRRAKVGQLATPDAELQLVFLALGVKVSQTPPCIFH
jgi:hypothetical protein